MNNKQSLHDKVVLVTGGAQGLGAAIVEALAEEGAVTIAADVKTEGLEAMKGKLNGSGEKVHTYRMDVSDRSDVEDVTDRIVKDHGKLDVVINNAAVDYTKPISDLDFQEWEKVIGVNLHGPFYVSKTAFPHLARNGSGHIVNIVSTASKRTWANAAAYHASKWGLLGLSHALHVEARPSNIKVTAVVAGGMQTPFILERFPDVDPNVLQDPKNVAATVKFILTQPAETVIPEVMVIPMRETSWP